LQTTIGQSGSLGRLINWVDDAWSNLQTEREDWEFMRSSNLDSAESPPGISFATVAAQSVYPLGSGAGTVGVTAANFGKWARETFRCQVTATGINTEVPLDWVPYDIWRDVYMLGAMRNVQTRPVVIAIGPNKELCLGPPPDGTYTVTGDYYIAPTAMAQDTDVPTGLPARFHMLLVYDAMDMYASYESAPEVAAWAAKGRAKLLPVFQSVYLPPLFFAGALC
jgi:hypothetical protein